MTIVREVEGNSTRHVKERHSKKCRTNVKEKGEEKVNRNSESGNERGSGRDKLGATAYNSIDVLIVNCPSDVLEFFFPVIVLVETRASDGIYVDMSRDSGGWFPIMIIVAGSVFGKGGVQFSGLINRFIKGKGVIFPFNGGIGCFEPGQS